MIVVVPVDPPRAGLVLSSLVETMPLSESDAVALYEAAVSDVVSAVAASGGELLINYRDETTLPDAVGDESAESAVREAVDTALKGVDVDDVRFERQVGSNRSARVGNTVTHLLEREGADSVGVLEPTVPLIERSDVDQTAMALRRDDVVLGPSSEGDVYMMAATDTIDFTDAYATTPLSTLARRGADAQLRVGFSSMRPSIGTPSGLRETIAILEARQAAGRRGGEATAAALADLGVSVGDGGTLERA
ncbi:hypothetical protein D8Y22_13215 [Salinadaptatus halalkaliphilus]|uniref:DUF2064 domain-containing protein n=1 Tax=Salinadaptatus halalkaliphilus TaxID=2419781 RepID=A0A4S3TP48_9EURY|nr:hypothetical protein [Salinadaptatus halalkaliphilus]THE64368.1 hypothetical protein D8Y22_13215 [Salinadaptatus halalkaliphilus]